MTNRERARELATDLLEDVLPGANDDAQRHRFLTYALETALDEASRQGEERMRERAARAVNDLDAPPETTDANIGELRGLCRAEAAIRALEPEASR